MSASPSSRRRRAGSTALLSACLLLGPAAVAAPARAAAPTTQAPGTPPGEWWWDEFGVGKAHEITTGEGAVVAMIDSPVHPDATELQGQDVVPVRNYCEGYSEAVERDANSFHGTSMTAMIVGNGKGPRPGTTGMRGVAPGATVRVYAVDDARKADEWTCGRRDDTPGLGVSASISRAIIDATDDGVDIINLSMAFGGLNTAVDYAVRKGVVVVASVNSLTPGLGIDSVGLPASLPGVVAVAASDVDGVPWSGQGYGNVDVAAPGVDVRSGRTTPDGAWSADATNTGTSPAAAYVSGVLALVKSRWPAATGPQLVQHLLRNTADEGATVWDEYSGFGSPSLSRLLSEDASKQPDHFPFGAYLQTPEGLTPAERLAYLDAPQPGDNGTDPDLTPLPQDATPAPAPSTSPAAATPPSAAGEQPADGLPLLPVGLGAAAVAALGAGALVLRRRSSSPRPPAPEGL